MFAQQAHMSSRPEYKKKKKNALTLGKDTAVTLPWKQASSEQASLPRLSPTDWFLISKDISWACPALMNSPKAWNVSFLFNFFIFFLTKLLLFYIVIAGISEESFINCRSTNI